MKRRLQRMAFFAALAIMPAAGSAAAQPQAQAQKQAADAAPTADQIIDRYVTAIGGREAWMKLHSRTALGTIELPSVGASGTVMIHEKEPNHVLQVVILQGAVFRQGFDGQVAWSEDPSEGLKIKSGAELAEMQRESDFYHVIHLKDFYTKLALSGKEDLDGKSAWVVEGTALDGRTEKMYFDAESWLLKRSVIQRHTGDELVTFQQDLDDYRDVDGVKLPFLVHQSGGDAPFTIRIEQFRQNVDLDDKEFAKPDIQ